MNNTDLIVVMVNEGLTKAGFKLLATASEVNRSWSRLRGPGNIGIITVDVWPPFENGRAARLNYTLSVGRDGKYGPDLNYFDIHHPDVCNQIIKWVSRQSATALPGQVWPPPVGR